MSREAIQPAQYGHEQARIQRKEFPIGDILRAQEESRQYHGAILEQEREAMFDKACARLGKTPEQINTAIKEVAEQEERLRSRGPRTGGGGELLEISAMLAGPLELYGKNAKVIPTAKHDDYFKSVDFVIEWTVPDETGVLDNVRLGVDVKQIRAGSQGEQRKQEIQEDLARGGPLRDLEFTVSDAAVAGNRGEQISVPVVTAAVDMDSINGFFADLMDQRTGSIRDPLDARFQRTLRDEFARNRFRGTLLTSLRETINGQIQALEQSKNTYKGNEFELRKIDRALYEIRAVRDIIDAQRKELGIGEVIPFRSREQQEQDAIEKSERVRMNKLLDDQEKRLREFFKDTSHAFGMTAEEYIASRKAAAPVRSTDDLMERAYEPAALKKITKRLGTKLTPSSDAQKAKQIAILLSKSPLESGTYGEAKKAVEDYWMSHPNLGEKNPSLNVRIEGFLEKDEFASNVINTLRAHADEHGAAA